MARRLFLTRCGRTCFSLRSSCWPWRLARFTSGRLDRADALTRRLFKQPRSRTTSFCGCTRCFRCFRHPWRRRLLIGPVVVIIALILLPFLFGEGEKSWRRRPVAVLSIMLIAVTLGTFTHLARYAPWSPHMNAWSGDPVPERFLKGTTALERQGALVFQVKQCRNCHSLDELGGQRGPTLDSVAVRLTRDQLIRQVIQGGGNMPAYGKNLSPAETTALVAFLATLHPPGQAPARDAALEESGTPAAVPQR